MRFTISLRQQVLDWLAEQVPSQRLQHSLRVEAFAVGLAQHHDLDVDQAAQAGLMHDLAKCFPPHRLLQVAQQERWRLDPVDRETPHLLHADVSAVVARDQFGVKETTILAAIANHTLGSPDMDALSCVVFLADTLEPGRGDTVELNHLRQLCPVDLEVAVRQTCDYTLAHLISKGRSIHPRALLTRNAFLRRSRRGTSGPEAPVFAAATQPTDDKTGDQTVIPESEFESPVIS